MSHGEGDSSYQLTVSTLVGMYKSLHGGIGWRLLVNCGHLDVARLFVGVEVFLKKACHLLMKSQHRREISIKPTYDNDTA